MLSHRNLLAMTVSHLADVESFDEGASQIHAAPMSHGSGLYIPAYIARGARQVIPASSSFGPDQFLDLCTQHPACGAFLAPTMVQRLRLEAERTGRRVRNLRTIGWRWSYVRRKAEEVDCHVRPGLCPDLRTRRGSDDDLRVLRRADPASQDERILGSAGWSRTGVEVAVVGPDGSPCPRQRQSASGSQAAGRFRELAVRSA